MAKKKNQPVYIYCEGHSVQFTQSEEQGGEVIGCDKQGNIYEIREAAEGWQVLKQGRIEVTFRYRGTAVACARQLASMGVSA